MPFLYPASKFIRTAITFNSQSAVKDRQIILVRFKLIMKDKHLLDLYFRSATDCLYSPPSKHVVPHDTQMMSLY